MCYKNIATQNKTGIRSVYRLLSVSHIDYLYPKSGMQSVYQPLGGIVLQISDMQRKSPRARGLFKEHQSYGKDFE